MGRSTSAFSLLGFYRYTHVGPVNDPASAPKFRKLDEDGSARDLWNQQWAAYNVGCFWVSSLTIGIPYWALTACAALLPIANLLKCLRNRLRLRRGLCPTCGYDLRASKDQCPECGSPIPSKPQMTSDK